ncbi:hypothetical protein FRC02_004409 [Tulasnella sp. 418]|nr:hypothetical protein FRC02_004409 [Tulasnella sp. 418]
MSRPVGLKPPLFPNPESLKQFAGSDASLGVALSPRANELAVFTVPIGERKVNQGFPGIKAASIPGQNGAWFAKWGSIDDSTVHLYTDAFVTFQAFQGTAAQHLEDGVPLDSSQNLEFCHRYVELYHGNVQAHLDRLAVEQDFNAKLYSHYSTVLTTLHLFQTIYAPQSGIVAGLVGEELLFWLNINFVAPRSEEGQMLAAKEKPWLEDEFWMYLIRCTIRGLSAGAMHFFSTLASHPSATLRRIAPLLPPLLKSHPRSTSFRSEHEFFSAHRKWKDSLRRLRSEIELLEDSDGQGDWREGLEDLLGVLEGNQEVIMKVCGEDVGGGGWREVIGIWGVWVEPNLRRDDLPDTLALILDSLPLDPTLLEETVHAAALAGEAKRFIQLSSELDIWFGSHIGDVFLKLGYNASVSSGTGALSTPSTGLFAELDDRQTRKGSEDQDEDSLTLRDFLLMDYAAILHSDPSLWQLEFDYLAACGDVGRARLGEILRRMAVDVEVDEKEKSTQKGDTNGAIGLKDKTMAIDEGEEPTTEKLGELTGLQRVEKLVEWCKDYELWDELRSLCKVVAQLLVRKRRYGDAVSYSIWASDVKGVGRIADLLLEEYIEHGAAEFCSLVSEIPDLADLRLDTPSFLFNGRGVEVFTSRLQFLARYAEFHEKFRSGDKKDAAKILVLMLKSGIVPRWWWGVVLIDAAGMLEDEALWFTDEEAYELLRHLEEIYIRAQQGCGADYLGALQKIMKKSGMGSSDGNRQENTNLDPREDWSDEQAIAQLEAVRLALARYLARSFTARAGRPGV